jgi:hypothetical protein
MLCVKLNQLILQALCLMSLIEAVKKYKMPFINGRQLESFIKEGTQKDLDTVTRIYHKWYGLRKIGMVLKGYTQGVNDFQMLRVAIDDAYRGLQNKLHPTGNKLTRFLKTL